MNYYGGRYVSRSLGFVMGWLYLYSFAIFIPFELTASALAIDYWHLDIHGAVWITIMLITVVTLNCLPIKFYGETEFWFAGLKVVTIVGLTRMCACLDILVSRSSCSTSTFVSGESI